MDTPTEAEFDAALARLIDLGLIEEAEPEQVGEAGKNLAGEPERSPRPAQDS